MAGLALLSPVISFRSYCNTLQGEMGVIPGNSGLQEARTFTVPSNPGDFMIRGVWPHKRAVLPWTRERDLTGSSTCRVLGRFYHNYPRPLS